MNNALMFGTGKNATGTPLDFFEACDRRAGGFVADMAADQMLTLHRNWYGPDHPDSARRDCLSVDWPTTGPVWLNPPYSEPENACARLKKTGELNCKKLRCPKRGWHTDVYIPGCVDFVQVAAEQRTRGVETWALLAARTDNEWFHAFVWDSFTHQPRVGVTVEFLEGRLVFRREGKPEPAPFPSMLVIFKPEALRL